MWTASVHILSPFGDGLTISTLDGSVTVDDQGRPNLRLRVRLDHSATLMHSVAVGSREGHVVRTQCLQALPRRFHRSVARLLKARPSRTDGSHHLELRAALASPGDERIAPRFVLYAVTVLFSEIQPRLGDISELASLYLAAFARLFWLQAETSVVGIRPSQQPAEIAPDVAGSATPRTKNTG